MIHLNIENFVEEVLESEKPVLIDFWAPWCNPCRMMSPELEAVEKELGDEIKFCKLNTEENPQISQQYAIMGIPTIIIFSKGKIIGRFSGYADRKTIKKMIKNILM